MTSTARPRPEAGLRAVRGRARWLSTVDLATQTIRTERLLLRPFRAEDVDDVHRASQDPETRRRMSVVIEAGGRLAGTGGLPAGWPDGP